MTQSRSRCEQAFGPAGRDVAWIIPVPHPPDRVEEADDAVFARLDDLTAPRFYSVTPAISIGCERNPHCPQEIGRIVVAQTGKAGIYDYTVLTATGVEALLNWLKEHSYHVPDGSKRIFSKYVDRGWRWLAIRVSSQHFDSGAVATRPIRYSYRDKQCVYPLIISQLSADDENEILLYVLSRRPTAVRTGQTGGFRKDRLDGTAAQRLALTTKNSFALLRPTLTDISLYPSFYGTSTTSRVRVATTSLGWLRRKPANRLMLQVNCTLHACAVLRRDAMDRERSFDAHGIP